MKKKVQLISMTTYCHKTKTFGVEDMIIEYVQKEDVINHPFVPMEVPKLNYPSTFKKNTPGMYNFFVTLLP